MEIKCQQSEEHTSCQEICGIEAPEDLESVDEDEEYSPSGAPISDIRLEAIVVRVFRQIETLRDHSTTWHGNLKL